MNLYIENKSFGFVKKAYDTVSKTAKKDVRSCIIINKKFGFNFKCYRFFRKKKIYDIEYVIIGEKRLKTAIKYLHKKNKPIKLTVIITKTLSEKSKKILSNICKVVKIIDYTNSKGNFDFYQKSKWIICKTKERDMFFEADALLLAQGFDAEYQCKCSSCLGKNLYVSSNGNVSFCIEFPNETCIGSLNDKQDYFENEKIIQVVNRAIVRRRKCKAECDRFESCMGFCPLQEDCRSCYETIKMQNEYIENIKRNNKDLIDEHVVVSKALLKDIFYTK